MRQAGLAVVLLTVAFAAGANEPVWSALERGGHVVLMRHALAPGIGDPAGFDVERCETQRNLDAHGQAQARRIGKRLRDRGIRIARVLSSRWCRCLETARLLALGPVTPEPTLDSFFNRPSWRARQTEGLRRIASTQTAGNRVLVTHQVNIGALTGQPVASGEMVVLKPLGANRFRVVGSIPAP